MIDRRVFLRNLALAMVGAGTAPLWLERALYAGTPAARKKILVAIFQRGAADGLNIVVPHGDKRYYDLRPTISIPRPSANIAPADSMIDLDGRSSTRIRPPLSPKAWRAEFVMSSDTISPSRQQRSASIWNGRSTSKSLIPFTLSLEPQIARQSCRRYAAASMRPLCSGICKAWCTSA